MELYTSLTRLKMAMNGGMLPPMTPVPEKSLALIDPAFVPGQGALCEDEERGLRCPIRGCGKYFHRLSSHISSRAHTVSVREVRSALGIPQTVSLMSRRARENASRGRKSPAAQEAFAKTRSRLRDPRRGVRARTASWRASKASMMARNLADRCVTQLAHKVIDLGNRLGREPNSVEFAAEYGEGLLYHVCETFGSWNAAKAHVGMKVVRYGRGGVPREAVLEALAAWYERHGRLPSTQDYKKRERVPWLPGRAAILRVFGADSWAEAMRRAASVLDIYGGPYGLPPLHTPVAAVAA